MNEYIERRFAVDAIADTMAKGFVEDRFILPQELQDLQDELEMLPAADVAPVVHGRRESHLMPLAYKCSVCGYRPSAKEWRFHERNFCPNCGAKMDLDAE